MDTEEIISNLDKAINELIERDKDILERGLNELNISGRLVQYLIPLFNGFDIDSEYNGDKLKPQDRKALDIAKNRMLEIGITPNEHNNYKFTPDIIIHIKNKNDNNLVVLELKKDSNSKKNKEFDLLKLEHLTIDYSGNHYNYKIGVAIVFGTKKNAGQYEVRYFQNGIILSRENLK